MYNCVNAHHANALTRKYSIVLLHIMFSFKVKYSGEATTNTCLSINCSFDCDKQKWGKPDNFETII